MNTNLAIDISNQTGSLEAYIQSVNQFPMLGDNEERQLAIRLRDEGDLYAARHMVMSHLRFVVHVARGYSGYGLPQADLIQEGNIGLMKAVKRFDPERNVRLVSFAVHWIKAEMHEYILRNWRIVKLATTKAQRKLFFNLRKNKKRLGWFTQAEVNTVAKELNVSPEIVLEMEKRMSSHDAAYDGYNDSSDSDDFNPAPAGYLTSENDEPGKILEDHDWRQHNQERLQSALGELDERSLDILQQRWLAEKKATLHQLASKYSISAERVRQLEKNAMGKLKTSLSV